MKYKILWKSRISLMMLMLIVLIPVNAFGQAKQIKGIVYDEDGSTLPGVNVTIEGTSKGVITDIEGNFTIEAEKGQTLVFSFVGFVKEKVLVKNQTELKIIMKSDIEQMEEFVVVGYGVQKKASVVGAINQVSGNKLQEMKTGGSIENSLQGNLPGLTVISTDPTPGEEASGITMLIRGSASLNANNPLIIVDGVERSFSNLDPNEIASVSILKDASATAVYGTKGANGVIIVTTKRGSSGKVDLEFSSEVTMKEATRLPKYLNAYETLKMRNVAYRNDDMWSMLYSDEELMHYRDQDMPYVYSDFDWMDFLFKPAFDHNYNLNARGGNDFVQYFVSVGYLHEGDIYTVGNLFPYQYDNYNAHYFHDRYNFRNNLDFNLSPTTKLSLNLGGNIKKWGRPFDAYTHETWFEPVTLVPYYPVDVLDKYPDNVNPYDQNNIRFAVNPEMGNVRLDWIGGRGFDRFKSNQLNLDLTFQQQLDFITKGLSFKGLYSYNNSVVYQENFRPGGEYYGFFFGYYLNPDDLTWSRYNSDGGFDPDTPQPKLESMGDGLSSAFRSHYYRLQFDYSRSFGNHNVGALALFSRRRAISMVDFPAFEEDWVGRATYNYKNKYFIEGNASYTGSEQFSPENRFGFFPAMAAGWLMSEEKFFKPVKPYINNLKFRYSYGKVGYDYTGDRWRYLTYYSEGGSSPAFGYPFTYYPVITEGAIPVPDISWEIAIKQNIGVEIGILQNMVTLNIDLFNEHRSNILQGRNQVPSWVGVSDLYGNIGETKGHGFEVELGFNKTFANRLNLYATANLTGNESRVIKYDEPETKPANISVEGKPVEIAQRMGWYTPAAGVEVEGYYQNIDELFIAPVASGVAPIVGDHKYLDYNGDGAIDAQDYVVSAHPYAPMFTWNAKLGANYRGWNFQMDFYGISDVDYQMRQGGMFYLYPFSQNKDNALVAHADYWTPTNTDASYPAVHSRVENNPNYRFSSFSNVNGKYSRLKNVRLGYTFDLKNSKILGIQKLEMAVTGTNLYTWTDYPLGGDPEGANSGTDFGAYPQMKRYTFEIRANF
ncbi:SusC/RagA family TonB-linked outer membrane protein [Saccharicrinis sp. FJH62]|uniref:SusC/RagA family TonB-linked outer membrane protein n=1 Tax=Saccharicrinis sp. FJH62 TaxID=3344657 RepID=UPI0035D49142